MRRTGGIGRTAAPAAAAIEEAIEDAIRRRAAARLGLLDDDFSLPGQRVDDEQILDAGRLERLLRLQIAEIEDAFRAGLAERLRERACSAGQLVVPLHDGGVGVAGLAVPLRPREQRIRRLDRGVSAPGMLVEERRVLVRRGSATRIPLRLAAAAQPSLDRLGHAEDFVGVAVDARVVSARPRPVGPMVGPVAALPADGLAVTLAKKLAELGRGDELEFVRAILTVPALHEFRHPRIGRAVVDAHRMRRLAVEEIVRDNPGRSRAA